MIVLTQVDSERAGVRLTINRQGRIEKEERISLPVGTTVRLIDFLKNIPVRREAAIKASAKSLKKIKRLLQSYAFARPSVRFPVIALKTMNDHGNWEYVPTRQPTALDAAVKIVGKRVVDQCQWKVWNFGVDENPIDPELEINEGASGACYKFEAIIPTPSCVIPTDANVEPAKDVADTGFVIAGLERFLKSIYGELQTPTAASRPTANPKPGAFDLLLARKLRPTKSPIWTAERRGRKIPSNDHGVGEQVEEDETRRPVELQFLDSVTEITFVRCIETLVTDMRRDTYIHAHKDCKLHKETCWITHPTRPETRGGDFVSAPTLPLHAPLSGMPELQGDRIRGLMPRQRLGRNLKKGSFSLERVLPNIRLVRNASASARSDSDSVTDSSLVHSISTGNPGLVVSNDGERRRQGTLQAIEQLKPMTEPRTANTLQENFHPSHNIPPPYKNCQTLKALCLSENTPAAASPNPNPKAVFEPGDPRAYLLDCFQQQHNNNNNETLNPSSAHHLTGQNRIERTLLPLEELATRDLILVIPTEKLDINGLIAGLRSPTGTSKEDGYLLDEYIASGKFVGGFPFHSENYDKSSMQTHQYESKIRALLKSVYGDEAGAEIERINFSSDLSTVR